MSKLVGQDCLAVLDDGRRQVDGRVGRRERQRRLRFDGERVGNERGERVELRCGC